MNSPRKICVDRLSSRAIDRFDSWSGGTTHPPPMIIALCGCCPQVPPNQIPTKANTLWTPYLLLQSPLGWVNLGVNGASASSLMEVPIPRRCKCSGPSVLRLGYCRQRKTWWSKGEDRDENVRWWEGGCAGGRGVVCWIPMEPPPWWWPW
jgi:hypothetical protein